MCACGSADGRRRRATCGRRGAARDERVESAASSSSKSRGFGAKDTSEVAARWQNHRGDGGLAFEVFRAIGAPSEHSSKEGASAPSSPAPLTRRGGKSGLATGGNICRVQEASEGNLPSGRAEENAACAGRLPRASIEGPPGSVASVVVRGSRDDTRIFAGRIEHHVREESLKLVGVVKRTRPGLRVGVSYLGVCGGAAQAAVAPRARADSSQVHVHVSRLHLSVRSIFLAVSAPRGVAARGSAVRWTMPVGRRRSSSHRAIGCRVARCAIEPARRAPLVSASLRDRAESRRSGASSVTP